MNITFVKKRLQKELHELLELNDPFFTASPVDERDCMIWQGYILGPKDSVYENGKFSINIVFPNNYPFSAPTITFQSPIFHPNVSTDGYICLDILKDQWSPALSISKVLLSIISLLLDPNTSDPMVKSIAELYDNDRDMFNQQARKHTLANATLLRW